MHLKSISKVRGKLCKYQLIASHGIFHTSMNSVQDRLDSSLFDDTFTVVACANTYMQNGYNCVLGFGFVTLSKNVLNLLSIPGSRFTLRSAKPRLSHLSGI